MTYFQACKLNCQICKTYFCFGPSFSALSFANSRQLELTLANRNFKFHLTAKLPQALHDHENVKIQKKWLMKML